MILKLACPWYGKDCADGCVTNWQCVDYLRKDSHTRAADPTGDGAPDTGRMREEIDRALRRYLDAQADYADRGNMSADLAELWSYLGPVLAPLLAERERVRALADEWERRAATLRLSAARDSAPGAFANRLRAALRGDA